MDKVKAPPHLKVDIVSVAVEGSKHVHNAMQVVHTSLEHLVRLLEVLRAKEIRVDACVACYQPLPSSFDWSSQPLLIGRLFVPVCLHCLNTKTIRLQVADGTTFERRPSGPEKTP